MNNNYNPYQQPQGGTQPYPPMGGQMPQQGAQQPYPPMGGQMPQQGGRQPMPMGGQMPPQGQQFPAQPPRYAQPQQPMYAQQPQQPAPAAPAPRNVINPHAESKFTGGLLGLIGISILQFLLSLFVIGVPFAICLKEEWLARHTIINGYQLRFDGTGAQLFCTYIKWLLLTIITIGIYGLWIPIKMKKWVIQHTTMVTF